MFSKLLCFLGYHSWRASLDDYLEEFGALSLNSKQIASTSVCSRCGKKYKE